MDRILKLADLYIAATGCLPSLKEDLTAGIVDLLGFEDKNNNNFPKKSKTFEGNKSCHFVDNSCGEENLGSTVLFSTKISESTNKILARGFEKISEVSQMIRKLSRHETISEAKAIELLNHNLIQKAFKKIISEYKILYGKFKEISEEEEEPKNSLITLSSSKNEQSDNFKYLNCGNSTFTKEYSFSGEKLKIPQKILESFDSNDTKDISPVKNTKRLKGSTKTSEKNQNLKSFKANARILKKIISKRSSCMVDKYQKTYIKEPERKNTPLGLHQTISAHPKIHPSQKYGLKVRECYTPIYRKPKIWEHSFFEDTEEIPAKEEKEVPYVTKSKTKNKNSLTTKVIKTKICGNNLDYEIKPSFSVMDIDPCQARRVFRSKRSSTSELESFLKNERQVKNEYSTVNHCKDQDAQAKKVRSMEKCKAKKAVLYMMKSQRNKAAEKAV